MAVKMNPVLIRRKITETEATIATMRHQEAAPEMIRIEERKLMVLNKWLEEAGEETE